MQQGRSHRATKGAESYTIGVSAVRDAGVEVTRLSHGCDAAMASICFQLLAEKTTAQAGSLASTWRTSSRAGHELRAGIACCGW